MEDVTRTASVAEAQQLVDSGHRLLALETRWDDNPAAPGQRLVFTFDAQPTRQTLPLAAGS